MVSYYASASISFTLILQPLGTATVAAPGFRVPCLFEYISDAVVTWSLFGFEVEYASFNPYDSDNFAGLLVYSYGSAGDEFARR